MPGLALRDFECTLCQKNFTMMGADFHIPEPDICDEYLVVVWPLDGEALADHITKCLTSRAVFPVSSVVQYIQRQKEQSASAEAVIEFRNFQRGMME